MSLAAFSAWVFLPLALPICAYVAWTDVTTMKIRNHAVLALLGVYLVLGPVALPFESYLWGLATLVAAFVAGFVLSAAGTMGAGDAKFLAVAAPFVAPGDVFAALLILAAAMILAFILHRLARASSFRDRTPHWESWTAAKFPLGLALGPALAAYLILAAAGGT